MAIKRWEIVGKILFISSIPSTHRPAKQFYNVLKYIFFYSLNVASL